MEAQGMSGNHYRDAEDRVEAQRAQNRQLSLQAPFDTFNGPRHLSLHFDSPVPSKA